MTPHFQPSHYVSQVYYIDYLKLCRNYGLTKVDIPESVDEEAESDAVEEKRGSSAVR